MPNWAYNTLTIQKSDRDLILTTDEDGEPRVDFGILAPMPESLNTSTGSEDDSDIYVYLSDILKKPMSEVLTHPAVSALIPPYKQREIRNNKPEEEQNRLIKEECKRLLDMAAEHITRRASRFNFQKAYGHGKILVENYMNYGATSWYDWSCENWGTKWNACETSVVEDKNRDEIIHIEFQTAWSEPYDWLKKLAEKGVKFDCRTTVENGGLFAMTSDGNGNAAICEGTMQTFFGCDDEDDEDDKFLPSDEEIAKLEKEGVFVCTTDDDTDVFERMFAVNKFTTAF